MSSTRVETTMRFSRSAASAVAISVLMLGLAGCQHTPKEDTYILGQVIPDHAQRHPIVVTEAPVFLEVEVPRGSSGLTMAQRYEVQSFLAGYRSEGQGGVTISAPGGSHNEGAAMAVAGEIKRLAYQMGVDGSAIYMEPYGAPNYPSAPVKISFTQTVAKGPDCGYWPDNLAATKRNTNYYNFGCSQQANIAAMVANPRDLLHPRTMDPRAVERGYAHWERYVNGQPTGAQKSEDEKSGQISEVARN